MPTILSARTRRISVIIALVIVPLVIIPMISSTVSSEASRYLAGTVIICVLAKASPILIVISVIIYWFKVTLTEKKHAQIVIELEKRLHEEEANKN